MLDLQRGQPGVALQVWVLNVDHAFTDVISLEWPSEEVDFEKTWNLSH